MKIGVTATTGGLDAQVDPRFGRSRYFVFVDPDTMAHEAVPNEAMTAPGGAGIQAAQAVINKGADVVISGNIGPNAFQVLASAGVRIATGASGTVKDAVEQYRSGKLTDVSGSTVDAHAGMGMGRGGSRGMRGMGSGLQQPEAPKPQSQRMPAEVLRVEEGELEELSKTVDGLEKELTEVKQRIQELKQARGEARKEVRTDE
jgi:predicted Fe-Mo cluster-binding NifX family protein